jgi:hypothetical protein
MENWVGRVRLGLLSTKLMARTQQVELKGVVWVGTS